jgi:hypothetical protein
MTPRKRTGAPLTVTPSIVVTWPRVQRVSDSPGILRQAVLDVVTTVVVHLADWAPERR